MDMNFEEKTQCNSEINYPVSNFSAEAPMIQNYINEELTK